MAAAAEAADRRGGGQGAAHTKGLTFAAKPLMFDLVPEVGLEPTRF